MPDVPPQGQPEGGSQNGDLLKIIERRKILGDYLTHHKFFGKTWVFFPPAATAIMELDQEERTFFILAASSDFADVILLRDAEGRRQIVRTDISKIGIDFNLFLEYVRESNRLLGEARTVQERQHNDLQKQHRRLVRKFRGMLYAIVAAGLAFAAWKSPLFRTPSKEEMQRDKLAQVQRNPVFEIADHGRRANMLWVAGLHEEALLEVHRALEEEFRRGVGMSDPRVLPLLQQRAVIHEAMGNPALAILDLKALGRHQPVKFQPEPYQSLIRLYRTVNFRSRALVIQDILDRILAGKRDAVLASEIDAILREGR